MPLNPLRFLPQSWKTDVIWEETGGKDERNNPRPAQQYNWPNVLVGARATSDPLDYSDIVENRILMYGENPEGFVPGSTATVIIPEGARLAGRWTVRGRPSEWPYGWEIVLDRENAATDRPARRA